MYCMLSSDGSGGTAPSQPLKHTDLSQGAQTWAQAGCSPRKTKAHSGKFQMALRWKTHGVGLSRFQHGCQISLMTADILKCHSNLPPSRTICLLLLEPWWELGHHQGQERPHSWSTSAPSSQEKGGGSVFIYSNQCTEGTNPMCKQASGCSSVDEQIRGANSSWHS